MIERRMFMLLRSTLLVRFLLFLAVTTHQDGSRIFLSISVCQAFSVLPSPINIIRTPSSSLSPSALFTLPSSILRAASTAEDDKNNDDDNNDDDKPEWNGEVVSNTPDGVIQGCSLDPVSGSSLTEWIVTIDGVEADLGRFSEAVYKKVMSDAKREKFKGFRPGTIPPILEPNYRAFSMEECARETVLEAMQQNNLRPFESARTEMKIEKLSIPPPPPSSNKKKKNSESKKQRKSSSSSRTSDDGVAAVADQQEHSVDEDETETTSDGADPSWLAFETVQEAVAAGWRPGQSFSFIATNVKGQKVQGEKKGAKPLGLNF